MILGQINWKNGLALVDEDDWGGAEGAGLEAEKIQDLGFDMILV